MIPRLTSQSLPAAPLGLFEALLEAGFKGDFDRSDAARIVQATDNSIYQVQPSGILYPKDAHDLQILTQVLSQKAYQGLSLTARGGGTGTNGQSLTDGLVLDCARHMNKIISIDPEARRARVQAGVVKDQLNAALKPYGLFFAPELSTSSRATIGGMISTDACGQGSCLYGKTSNHVTGLRLVLADGTDIWSAPTADHELAARQDRLGEIARTLLDIEATQAEAIAEIFPKLNRYMTGYDLAHIRNAEGLLDINAVICGSEGTLALIAEAEVNLLPIPKYAALLNIQYADFNTALEDARTLVSVQPASVETVDEKVLGLARGDTVWAGIAQYFPQSPDFKADGINIVEVLAETPEGLEAEITKLASLLESSPMAGRGTYTVTREHRDIEAIWTMRKRAVGLLGNVEGASRPLPFVEDTAVPPENLAAYIRDFRALLDAEGVSYGMFGHVDAGVLHVRPALDLTQDQDRAKVRRISDQVVSLTQAYGGVLWGEHGKGVRSEYVPQYFGRLYPALQAIKAVFDPQNRLNPGKIAAPDAAPLLRIDEVPLRGHADEAIPAAVREAFDNGPFCNGNGACFDYDAQNVMCPSYKATRDRRHSPKGRASLLREWLRLLSAQGVDPRQVAVQARKESTVVSFFRRGWNTLNPSNRTDFSHQVREALDGCLGCKACSSQCPVKVNVPAFRSKFYELYYARYLRPLRHEVIGRIEGLLPLARLFRPLYNLSVSLGAGRVVGLTALPKMPKQRVSLPVADLKAKSYENAVVFVVDAFSAQFDPAVVEAAAKVARQMGMKPMVAGVANGKPLQVHGYLKGFEDLAATSAEELRTLSARGAILVGLDPSMTLAYRSEYAAAGQKNLNVLLPQEWLSQNLQHVPMAAQALEGDYRLMLHCTERSTAAAAAALWPKIFAHVGLKMQMPATGCCGMAGTFGHEVRNRGVSESLFDLSWRPVLEDKSGAVDLATGYSCRSQTKEILGRRPAHPLEILAQRLA